MSKLYTKRSFLKILGLGLVFMPFISCFDQEESKSNNNPKDSDPTKNETEEKKDASFDVNENDVIILSRNDKNYAIFNQGFNKGITKFPKYIAVCKTEKGIQFALQKAKAEQLKVAVKSGGHSFEGFSNNDGGMVINVSQMKNVKWIDDNTVQIEPGLLLQELHNELFPKNKLLPAGSCGTVAIAGLALGGGYGFFSRKFGLTCDSLLSVKMIDANAQIIDTKINTDDELMWALRGGGNGNYGVISSFTFKVYKMPATFSSSVLKFRNMTKERFKNTLATWFEISQQFPEDAFGAYVLNGSTLTVLITNYVKGNNMAALIKPLVDLADTVNSVAEAALAPAMKRYYGRKGPIYFKNASCGLYNGFSDLESSCDELFDKVIKHKGIIFQVNTLGGQINNNEFEKASCYPHRKLAYLGELQSYWEQESKGPALIQGFNSIQQLLLKNGIKDHYRNYPDLGFENWQTAYYGNNYQKLKTIKKRLDPDNLFAYEQSIEL